MTKFIGCIDLHNGEVKQIVGGTLTSKKEDVPKTNFVSQHPSSYYAKLYKDRDVQGCHVIKLGPNNDDAAREHSRSHHNFYKWAEELMIRTVGMVKMGQ